MSGLHTQIKTELICSLSAAPTLSVVPICAAANGFLMMLTFLNFIFTLWLSEQRDCKQALASARTATRAHLQYNRNDTDLFICDDVCRQCLSVRWEVVGGAGGRGFFLLYSL